MKFRICDVVYRKKNGGRLDLIDAPNEQNYPREILKKMLPATTTLISLEKMISWELGIINLDHPVKAPRTNAMGMGRGGR